MPFDGTITAKNICKTFQKEKVLENVSVTLNKGECLGILGYNGCGKSTLLSIIAGTLPQDLGEVLYSGVAIDNKLKKHIGYVPQTPCLLPELTVKDNLHLWHSAYSLDDFKATLQDIPKFLEIDNLLCKKAGSLSGGQAKCVSIAIALMPKLEFLILDEAFSALDTTKTELFAEYLQHLKKTGVGILYSDHHIPEIKKLCDNLVVLKNGQINLCEKSVDIFNRDNATDYLISFF